MEKQICRIDLQDHHHQVNQPYYPFHANPSHRLRCTRVRCGQLWNDNVNEDTPKRWKNMVIDKDMKLDMKAAQQTQNTCERHPRMPVSIEIQDVAICGSQLQSILDDWLVIDDWWLMIDDWRLMIDDWWLMIDDWRLMIDDWWLDEVDGEIREEWSKFQELVKFIAGDTYWQVRCIESFIHSFIPLNSNLQSNLQSNQ